MPVLTHAAIQKYKPQTQRREIRDSRAPGLYLVIQPKPTGSKSWAMRFRRPDGRPGKLTLGAVDLSDNETADEPALGGALTLRQARELANRVDRERARGIDVIERYKAAKGRQRTAMAEHAANTFGGAAREFFASYKTKNGLRPRRWRYSARLLGLRWALDADPAKVEPEIAKGGLAQRWAHRAVADIDDHDIHAVIGDARSRGVPGMMRRNAGESESRARHLYGALSVFFGWLHRDRRVRRNPCDDVDAPSKPLDRDRVLSDAELRNFWRAAETVQQPFSAVLRLLVLTGARLNEVVGMRRSEHGTDQIWTIPGSRTKNHRPNPLPLPPLAREIIASVPRIEGDLVFTLNGKRPVTDFSRMKEVIDAHMGDVAPWVFHDLRRTCASGMQKLGIADAVIERALNHHSGVYRGVAGIYQRDALIDDVCDALAAWARYVTLVIDADLYAAHEKYLATGDDAARKAARDEFRAAVNKGGDQWQRYLRTRGGRANSTLLPSAAAAQPSPTPLILHSCAAVAPSKVSGS